MDKLEYIPGDIVKIEYGEATGKIGFVTNTFLRRKGCYSLVVFIGKGFQGSSKDDWIQTYNDEVSPIPLTPEILEKNGWKKVSDYNYIHQSRKFGIVSRNRETYKWSIVVCGFGLGEYIGYVSELQHFLFGISLNHKMEV